MPSKIDSAILSAISLDAATTIMASHGGSGFASTFKLISTKDDNKKLYFVKIGKGEGARVMFEGPLIFVIFISVMGAYQIMNRGTYISQRNPQHCPITLPQI
jgi:hypothetical protein